MNTAPNLTAYKACIQRVTDWLLSELTDEGMIGDEADLIAYYHAPNLLAATGHNAQAQRVANWLKREALTEEGDFRRAGAKGNIIQPTMQWNYINGWLAWGLARLGRFDLSERAVRYLETFQDPGTGGFLTAARPEEGFVPVPGAVDMGSTCTGALAMIYTGRWPAAIRVGEFLMQILDTQPDSAKAFYCRHRADGRAITDFPEDQAYVSVVRFDQPRQAYWYFGFAARMLALLNRATGRTDFVVAAARYIDVFERCHDDRWEHWANDKVAWASAALYQTTGRPEHLSRIARCFNPIVRAQRDNHLWHWEAFFPDYAEQPRGITIELALEFAFLLHEIVGEIESVDPRRV
jgi:hypothetical protein